MNSKERVLKTLDREEPDRVPVGEWGIDHDTVEKVISHETYWRARAKTTKALWAGKRDEVVQSYKEDIVELIERLDQELVPVHLVPPKDLEPKEVKQIDEETWKDEESRIWRYSRGNDAILCTEPGAVNSFKSVEELKEYFELQVVEDFGFKIRGKSSKGYELEIEDESRLELIRYVIDKLGKDRFIFFRDISEFEVLSAFIGGKSEDFFLFIGLQPDLAREAYNLYSEIAIAMARIAIAEGVDAIMPGGDFSASVGPMISPQSIRGIFLPGMQNISDFAHRAGVRVMSHNCGNNWKIMDILIEAGYEAYQSIQSKTADMDLKRLKEKYGDKISFWGGINIENLVEGTPEENWKDVLYALKYAAPGGGFILGTSNSVAYGSRYDNYMSALEALHKYGNYPIKV